MSSSWGAMYEVFTTCGGMAWNGIFESPLWFAGIALAGLVVADQLRYQFASRGFPGPPFVIPFIGSLPQMVRAPFKFWDDHFKASKGAQSNDWLLGRPLVISGDGRTSREIFKACSESVPLALHPNADLLLAKNNLAFMNGPAHSKLKHELLSLFTNKRLAFYANIQQREIRRAIREWCASGKTVFEVRENAFALNIMTSLKVFVGPYLTELSQRELQTSYQTLTKGFLGWPINLPGTDLYRAVKARAQIIKRFEEFAGLSRAKMKIETETPACVLDFWMRDLMQENKHSTHDIACVMLDFEFAAQDASTSSLTWAAHYLAKRPDVKDKIREELRSTRSEILNKEGADSKVVNAGPEEKDDRILPGGAIDVNMLAKMSFTRAVVEELLRVRPPAPIVPHTVKEKAFHIPAQDQIGGLQAPIGSIVCPSIWNANREGISNPEDFDPWRTDSTKGANFLTFGDGRHRCIGQHYARQNLALFASLLCELCEFDRLASKEAEEIIYAPTLFPKDGCRLSNFRLRL